MRAVVKCACRGNGRAYVMVALDVPVSSGDVSVRALLGDAREVPCEWGIVPDGGEIVVVCPLWEQGSMRIEVLDAQNGGRPVASAALDGRLLRMQSRVNYRLRKDLVWGMRDFGDALCDEQAEVFFEDAIEDGGECYYRGHVRFPLDEGGACSFRCFDGEGLPLAIEPVVLGDDVRPSDALLLEAARDVRFSLRVPCNVATFTLVAEVGSDSRRRGFFTVLPSVRGKLIDLGYRKVVDASKDAGYPAWQREHAATEEQLAEQRALTGRHSTTFSVVVDACGVSSDAVVDTIESVKAQSHGNWNAVIVDCGDLPATGDSTQVAPVVVEPGVLYAPGLHTVADSLEGFVIFVGAGDVLEPDALHEIARAMGDGSSVDAVYVDSDRFAVRGRYAQPFFKPDFNIDLLRSYNYFGQLLCMRRDFALDEIMSALGSHMHDNAYRRALRVAELTDAVAHIPRILCHERVSALGQDGPFASSGFKESQSEELGVRSEVKQESLRDLGSSDFCLERSMSSSSGGESESKADASVQVVRDHLDRMGERATVEPAPWQGVQQVRYGVQGSPLVSIVIPNKDCSAMLDDCIRSIVEKTTYDAYEIVVVENNSVDQETFDYYDAAQREFDCVRVVKWPGEFNFSKIVNFGAAHAQGEYLLLLNNDTQVIAGEWLSAMMGVCQREGVGAVGARLLFRDGSIQHAGALVTDELSGAHHSFMHLPGSFPGYFLFGCVTRGVSIVSAACMLTPKTAFDVVGGFEEELTVAYNDVDYCLKLREQGFQVVYEPAAELYHFESVSRGYDALEEEKRVRLFHEESYMHYKWASFYVGGDPFFNPNLDSFYYRLKR